MRARLRDFTDAWHKFLPFDILETKQVKILVPHPKTITVVCATAGDMLFMYQAAAAAGEEQHSCELFFVLNFSAGIRHLKMIKDPRSKKLFILVVVAATTGEEEGKGGSGVTAHLLDISYERLVLNMTYELQILKREDDSNEVVLSNQMSSICFLTG